MDDQQRDAIKRVAVIGGGFSGCSTAYFLRLLLKKAVAITVFEKSDRLGGRVRSIGVKDGNELYETGGAIYTSNNKYMNMFVDQFGLTAQRHAPPDEALSLYSGRLRPCAFSSNPGPLFVNRLRFALLYGIDLVRFRVAITRHRRDFDQIYDLQKKGISFDSPIAMLGALSPAFLKMLKSTFESWLERHLKLSDRFCKDVVYGMVSNCYCSDLTLHAFAGMTAVSGFGTDFFSVVGGNERVAQKLCEAALQSNPPSIPRKVSLRTTVTKLSRGSKRRFLVTYENDGVERAEEFDFVVLAFPIHEKASAVPHTDGEIAKYLPPRIKYIEVDFTHFRGELEAMEFGLPAEKLRCGGSKGVTILPTYEGYEVEKSTLFKYLGRAWSTSAHDKDNTGTRVSCWSAFSLPQRTPDPGQQLLRYYAKTPATLINSSRWFAYPNFSVVQNDLMEAHGKFLLTDGLIYVNSLENLSSNMEMALIGGHNAALLVANSEDFKTANLRH
ncbi:Prenylcysteine oxidase-like [Taenia crassiceps]|uniref:Prenylcysteine oxidase-like n=1 Tax=Taenia crassiceps TaxID=6207 RepID=A0ABR4QGS6_9CEST